MRYIINIFLSVFVVTFCQAQDTVDEPSYPQINFHANLPIKEDKSASSYSNYKSVTIRLLASKIFDMPVTDQQRWNAMKLMYDYENSCMIQCDMLNQDSLKTYAANFDFNSELAYTCEAEGKLYFHEPITRFNLGFVNKSMNGLKLPRNLDNIEFISSINTECDALDYIQRFNNDDYIYWLYDSNSTLLLYAQNFYKDDDLVEMPSGIIAIADGAMRQSNIDALCKERTLIIPNSVKIIGHKSLENCGFSRIIIMTEDELEISSDAFGENLQTNTFIYANKKVQKKLKKSIPQLKNFVKNLDKKVLNELF